MSNVYIAETKARIHARQMDEETDESGNRRRVYEGLVASTALDTKFTRLMPSSLRNFARQASEGNGVPIFPDHDYYNEPMGRSIRGWTSNRDTEFHSEFFILAGSVDSRSGVNADNIIDKIDNRVMTDLSVGFTGGDWYCDIDDTLMRGRYWKKSENGHYLGEEIKQGENLVTVTARVENADLHHYSPVGVGSNPDTVITEIRDEMGDNKISDEAIAAFCSIHNFDLPQLRSALEKAPTIFDMGANTMAEQTTPTPEEVVAADEEAAKTTPPESRSVSPEQVEHSSRLVEEIMQLRTQAQQNEAQIRAAKALQEQHAIYKRENEEQKEKIAALEEEKRDGDIAAAHIRNRTLSEFVRYEKTRGNLLNSSDTLYVSERDSLARMPISQVIEKHDAYKSLANDNEMLAGDFSTNNPDKHTRTDFTPNRNVPPPDYAYNIGRVK